MVTRHPSRIGDTLRRLQSQGLAYYNSKLDGWSLSRIAPVPTEEQMQQLQRICIKNMAHHSSLHSLASNDGAY